MNSIDLLLLELIQIAEAPVYSAYRWLGRQLGRDLSMAEFFRFVGRLVEDDAIRLWAVDMTTGDRTRWTEIPPDLEQRYAGVPDLDDSFDPFGLSLTLGPSADVQTDPDWEVDFDFDERRFLVTAKPDAAERAHQHLSRLYPNLDFTEDERSIGPDHVRIAGSIADRPATRGVEEE